jgi:hypothetical protein
LYGLGSERDLPVIKNGISMADQSPIFEVISGFIFCLASFVFLRNSWLYLIKKRKFLPFIVKIQIKIFEIFTGKEATKTKIEELMTNKKLFLYGVEFFIGGGLLLIMGFLSTIEGIFRLANN